MSAESQEHAVHLDAAQAKLSEAQQELEAALAQAPDMEQREAIEDTLDSVRDAQRSLRDAR